MTSKTYQTVSSLDIWGIIEKEIPHFQEYAVEESKLYLEIDEDGESFVEISYYDINSLVYNENEPLTQRLELPFYKVYKMYREIDLLVNLPLGVKTLRTHLKKNRTPEFEITMMPIRVHKDK